MNNNIIKVTDETFKKNVIQNEKFVLVDFWAPWCGPCKTFVPILETVSKLYVGKLIVVKINIDDNPKIINTYQIKNIPTLLLFKNGKVIHSNVGVISQERLEHILNTTIN
ncbi:thioredoxin [Buchnera aphidicola (Nipponaphis monzeni)]|uniref:Thioredoxin n=1 Tax=Buchnera aphidicola (Nipponaphis monzeni) TaxID=2495405 RepID=A0A455TAZ0_9GAMM|nr:thioredoxin [Buchnera aphidicola]BBI01442.1 thioredoxin [Buchnera aphidicola (Nipponaphis monzeni)]